MRINPHSIPQLQSDSDETPARKKLWGRPSLTFSHPWEAEMNGKSLFPQHKRSTCILCMRLPRTKDNAAHIARGGTSTMLFMQGVVPSTLFLTLQSTSIFVVYVKYTMLASQLHTYLYWPPYSVSHNHYACAALEPSLHEWCYVWEFTLSFKPTSGSGIFNQIFWR